MNQTETGREVEVDLLQLLRALWKKAWLIILAAVIFGGAAFVYTKTCVASVYRASISMYVNNKSAMEQPDHSVSTGDISASQHLVETYTVFMKSRTTLDQVTSRLGLPYSYETLKKMVDAKGIGDTSAFEVLVFSKNPEEAARIANTLGEVLPSIIADFIPGSSVKVVDEAVIPQKPYSPSVAKNMVFGVMLGILFGCVFVIVAELADNQIHSTEYLKQNYDIPVLAVIPDLMTAGNHGGYYKETAPAARHPEKGGKNYD